MILWLLLVLRTLRGMARSRISLAAENAILRQQLTVLQRGRPRPLLRPANRVLWSWLYRYWSRWRQALALIQPATVLNWHREGYRRHWRRRSGRIRALMVLTFVSGPFQEADEPIPVLSLNPRIANPLSPRHNSFLRPDTRSSPPIH